MSNASHHLITEVLNHLTGESTWTAPTTLYIALLKDAPAAGDTTAANAAKEVEVPGENGYTRQEVSLGAEGSQQSASTALLTFGPSTTGWSEVVGVWLVDSPTTELGLIWGQGALAANKTAAADDSILFSVGEVIVSMA